MPNINTFQDILDALEQDPALREQLRWHILTDELLQLPAAVLEIRTDVAGLKNDVAEIKTSVASLQEGQARLETDVARMGGDLARMNGDLRRLTGKDYEDYVLRFAERLMNRNTDFERLSVAGSDKNGWAHPHMRERNTEAAISGTITFEEADDLEMTDVVLSGRPPLGGPRYVIIEASITVQEGDVLTAKRRAEMLQRVSGTATIPVVVGVVITEEARSLPEGKDVLFIPYNPGEEFSPADVGADGPPV